MPDDLLLLLAPGWLTVFVFFTLNRPFCPSTSSTTSVPCRFFNPTNRHKFCGDKTRPQRYCGTLLRSQQSRQRNAMSSYWILQARRHRRCMKGRKQKKNIEREKGKRDPCSTHPSVKVSFLSESFSPRIPRVSECGNNWKYASRYGGVLSEFVKYFRSKKIRQVVNHKYIIRKKISGKSGRLKSCAKKIWKLLAKKLSDKNEPYCVGLLTGRRSLYQPNIYSI